MEYRSSELVTKSVQVTQTPLKNSKPNLKKSMKKVWSFRGSDYQIREASNQLDKLPVGVYEYNFNPMMGPYLTRLQDRFVFPYKVYGIESKFIKQVENTWNNTGSNMGIILNGVKGTGKTVTAEIICNTINLPVIILRNREDSFIGFINEIQQDVIIFIDEYEKVYGESSTLLSLMDGVFNTKHRKMFLLTSNDLYVDRNLIQRPGRVRYIKQFGDLTVDVITEIVDDCLVYKELRDSTIEFISKLSIITVDIVKTIVEEVNIHNQNPLEFTDILNIHKDKDKLYNIYEMIDNEKVEIELCTTLYPDYIASYDIGRVKLRSGNTMIGKVVDIISDNEFLVEREVWEEVDGEEELRKVKRVIVVEPTTGHLHRSFATNSLVF